MPVANTLYIGTIGSVYHYQQTAAIDTDGDGIPDSSDNCTLVANANQQDTDADGYGNICDYSHYPGDEAHHPWTQTR